MFMFDRPLFADDMGIPIDIYAEAKVNYKLCGCASAADSVRTEVNYGSIIP